MLPLASVAAVASVALKSFMYSVWFVPNTDFVLFSATLLAVLWACWAEDEAAACMLAAPVEEPIVCRKLVKLVAPSPVSCTKALVVPVYSFDADRLLETTKLDEDPNEMPLLVPVLLL